MFLYNEPVLEINASCKTPSSTISTFGSTKIPNSAYEKLYMDDVEKVKDKKQEDKKHNVLQFKADTLFTMMQSPSILRMKSHNLAHTFTSYVEEEDKDENYFSTSRAVTNTTTTSVKENENGIITTTSSKTNGYQTNGHRDGIEIANFEVNGVTVSHHQDHKTNDNINTNNNIDTDINSNSIVNDPYHHDNTNNTIEKSFNAIITEVHQESSLDSTLHQISHKPVTKTSVKLLRRFRDIISMLSKPLNK